MSPYNIGAPGSQATKHEAGTAIFRPITNSRGARRRSPWPVKSCPSCHAVLDGGPTVFYCPACERSVQAAEVDNETHAPLKGAA